MEKRNLWLSRALTLLLALGFSLIFCICNTPLGPIIGSDNAMYLTMGTALCQGYAPYTQIFDHKGPLLFLLQMLPQAVSGGYSTLAVFLMEFVFLFACLRVLCAVCQELRAPCVPVQLAYLLIISFLLDGGNLNEEYANLFTLTGLYLALRAFGPHSKEDRSLTAYAAGMGAMTMLAFLLRANNALPLCAITLTLTAALLLRRKWSALGRCALGYTLGLAAAALPVVLWLAAQGALSESIYGSIIHNMHYAETGEVGRIHMLLCDSYGYAALAMAALTCAGALTLLRRHPALALSLIAGAAAAGMAAFISHKYYLHYLMLGAPLSAVGAALLFAACGMPGRRAVRILPAACAALCCAVLIFFGIKTNTSRTTWRESYLAYAADAQTLYAQVPEEDRSSFMAYRVEPRWYVAAEALPCMRFYFLQEILAQANPAVMDEIVETFETNPPRWLVIYYNRAFSPPYDERVAEIFARDYDFVDAQGEYQLLRLKETP